MSDLTVSSQPASAVLDELREYAQSARPIHRRLAEQVLNNPELDVAELGRIARIPREKFFGRRVQIHVLDNIRNGHCPEDCGYCAQRKTAPADSIVSYPEKSEEEIMNEAEEAYKSGAFRFCLVSAGRGPSEQSVARLSKIIRKVKETYPLEMCLSAGILKKPELAAELARAGLDRYNHNLNTSEDFYEEIASTHTYADREETLKNLSDAGVELCSGVIAGMGEGPRDMVAAACRLNELGVASIPVNFFIPVPGHALKNTGAGETGELSADHCLRLLALFRLTNPRAEIRMAAGREIYLKERQAEGLTIANSLFVSGYLNVKGSQARETLAMILDAGFEPDLRGSDRPDELGLILEDIRKGANSASETSTSSGSANSKAPAPAADREFLMKEINDLRPFRES